MKFTRLHHASSEGYCPYWSFSSSRLTTKPHNICRLPKRNESSNASRSLPTKASSTPTSPHFSDLPLNRAAHLRKDPDQLHRLLLNDPTTLTILLHQGKALVAPPSSPSLPTHSFAYANNDTTNDISTLKSPDGNIPSFLPIVLRGPLKDKTLLLADQAGGGDISPLDSSYFLGTIPHSGAAVFAYSTSQPITIDDNDTSQYIDVRSGGQHMTGQDAAVLALAAGLYSWHRSAAFCSSTGSLTQLTEGGHARSIIPSLTKEEEVQGRVERRRMVYPRIDPAVIVSVTANDGERPNEWVLLGRKAAWEADRWSLLAGFVEVGETFEQAVVREVEEEAGVDVDVQSVKYLSSQPWPFPRSLMVGFSSVAIEKKKEEAKIEDDDDNDDCYVDDGLLTSEEAKQAARESGLTLSEAKRYLQHQLPRITVDKNELEDARWFHADWLRKALDNNNSNGRYFPSSQDYESFRIPGKYALANTIITGWLEELRSNRNSRKEVETGGGEASSSSMSSIPDVLIDKGTFKYVLLRVHYHTSNINTDTDISPSLSSSKLIVRGDNRAPYHDDIRRQAVKEVQLVDPSLTVTPVGGGRMDHDVEGRVIDVYGFSSAFGCAVHDVTAVILRKWMALHDVHVRYDGY